MSKYLVRRYREYEGKSSTYAQLDLYDVEWVSDRHAAGQFSHAEAWGICLGLRAGAQRDAELEMQGDISYWVEKC